jgi:hypothetical protein
MGPSMLRSTVLGQSAIFAGDVEGDKMSGVVEFEGAGEGTWSAARVQEK